MSHPIPNAALDDRLAFVGNAGSGKTYSSGTAVERLLNSGARLVIPDPLGVWWGMALDKDGKTPSAFRKREDLVIFGGPRGDLPLNEFAGALIGETIAGMKESCIVDLSEIGKVAGERRFMLAMLGALYKNKTKEPLHVVFDEADMWAPQRVLDKEGEAMKLLGMMETICRRGRVKGFIPWLITQRPAVLNKNVLSQIDGMIAFQLTSVQDRDAIGDWVEGQADKSQWREMWADMATLSVGKGVVWIPRRAILNTAQFPEKTTFDSSRAPKRGERIQTADALQPVNLDKLKQRLAKVEAETKANDPKKLRNEIATLVAERNRLERQVAEPKTAPAPTKAEIKKVEREAYARGEAETAGIWFRRGVEAAIGGIKNFVKGFDQAAFIRKEMEGWKHIGAVPVVKPAAETTHIPRAMPSVPPRSPSRAKSIAPIGDGSFNRPQMRVLESLAMWRALGHETPSREMVAAAAGYSPSSGGFNNLLGGLGTMGAIGKPMPGHVSLLAEGVDTLDKEGGRDMLIASLNRPQRRIIAALIDAGARSREEVGEATGYSASSGGFNNLLGSLSTLGIVVKPQPGYIALADWAQELLADAAERMAA